MITFPTFFHFTGLIADLFGSYNPAFYLAASAQILAVGILFLTNCDKHGDTIVVKDFHVEKLLIVDKITVLWQWVLVQHLMNWLWNKRWVTIKIRSEDRLLPANTWSVLEGVQLFFVSLSNNHTDRLGLGSRVKVRVPSWITDFSPTRSPFLCDSVVRWQTYDQANRLFDKIIEMQTHKAQSNDVTS